MSKERRSHNNVTGSRQTKTSFYRDQMIKYESLLSRAGDHLPFKLKLDAFQENVLYKLSEGRTQSEVAALKKVAQSTIARAIIRIGERIDAIDKWVRKAPQDCTTAMLEDDLFSLYLRKFRVRCREKDNELMAELEELRKQVKENNDEK